MREEKAKVGFLARWSHLKQQPEQRRSARTLRALDSNAPPPDLPPVGSLSIDSDFSTFFHPKVDEKLRHAALRKLFGDRHFNIMDGLDVYIDDYSKSEPLPSEMLAKLKHGQQILAWAREDEEKRAQEAAVVASAAQPPALVEDQQLVANAVQPMCEPLSETQNVQPREKSRG